MHSQAARGACACPEDRSSIGGARRSRRNREGGAMRALAFAASAAAAILIGGISMRASAQSVIVGNDEKQGWDENGKPILREPGKDTLSILDVSKPDTPRIAATIPLMNSVVGPPTNLAIGPSGDIALVANSLEPVLQGWGRRLEPDNKLFL